IGLLRALGGGSDVPVRTVSGQLLVSLLPALAIAALLAFSYRAATAPVEEFDTSGLVEAGASFYSEPKQETGLLEPSGSTGLQEPPAEGAAGKPAESAGLLEPPGADKVAGEADTATPAEPPATLSEPPAAAAEQRPVPLWFWVMAGVGLVSLALIYALWTWQRFEIFKMLLGSFFPLSILILAVLGSIVFGFATPTEAAAVGAFGGFVLAAVYRFIAHQRGN